MMARMVPQPTIAGRTPSTGGRTMYARQPKTAPKQPRSKNTIPNKKLIVAQNLSKPVNRIGRLDCSTPAGIVGDW